MERIKKKYKKGRKDKNGRLKPNGTTTLKTSNWST